MGKTLQRRFKDQGIKPEEIIRHIELFGKWEAMSKYGVKDVLAFNRYLIEIAGNDFTGANPKIPMSLSKNGQADFRPVIYRAMEMARDKLINLQADNEALRNRNKFLEEMLKIYQLRDADKFADAVQPLLKVLNTPLAELLNDNTIQRKQLKTPKQYDILEEVTQVIEGHELIKPDSLLDFVWERLSFGAKRVCVQLEQIEDDIADAYWQVVRAEEWKQALLLYQAHIAKPRVPLLHREIDGDEKADEEEAQFIAEANEWVSRVKEVKIERPY